MPFALLIIGLVLIVSGVRDTTSQLTALVKGDFTGQGNFTYWMISILIIGSLGYIASVQKLSRAFMAVVLIGLLFSNRGFFAKFQQQIFGTAFSSNSQGSGIVQPSTSSLSSLLG